MLFVWGWGTLYPAKRTVGSRRSWLGVSANVNGRKADVPTNHVPEGVVLIPESDSCGIGELGIFSQSQAGRVSALSKRED